MKDLTAAGMEEKQAEVLADHQLAMLETHIATKADVLDLKSDIAQFKTELKKDMEWSKGASRFFSVVRWARQVSANPRRR